MKNKNVTTARTQREFKILALIVLRNELDVLPSLLAALAREGVTPLFIDDWSTDGTFEFLKKRKVKLVRSGKRKTKAWEYERVLKLMEELAISSGADWIVRWDADEVIRSNCLETLREGIQRADDAGYNAINCDIYNFMPTDNNYDGQDIEKYFPFCDRNVFKGIRKDAMRIWKNDAKVDMHSHAGHEILREDRRLAPYHFALKHYPFRTQQQAERKVFVDRKPRLTAENKKRGWHVHYNKFAEGFSFIKTAAEVIPFEEVCAPDVSLVTLTGFKDLFEDFAAFARLLTCRHKKIVVTSRGVNIDAPDFQKIEGIEPFVFSRNSNLGINANPHDDILLVNDDVTFIDRDAISKLRAIAHSRKDCGALSPAFIGGIGNLLQKYSYDMPPLQESQERLAFACVYIKRSVINKIGLLDESFTEYGGDDVDYCLRAQKAGFKLYVTKEVVVKHKTTQSFLRIANPIVLENQWRQQDAEKNGNAIVRNATIRIKVREGYSFDMPDGSIALYTGKAFIVNVKDVVGQEHRIEIIEPRGFVAQSA